MAIIYKCPNCGANLEVEPGELGNMICTHCNLIIPITKDHSVEIQKIKSTEAVAREYVRQKYRDKAPLDDNRAFLRIMLGFALFIVMIGLFISYMAVTHTVVPVSSKQCVNKQVQVIENQFRDAGFKYVYTEALNDLVDTWYSNKTNDVGKVVKITVNGIESFDKDKEFNKKDPVRIYYHSYPTEP